MIKTIEQTGSVRVDLVGGTLDFSPISLLLQNAVTLNMATSLKAKVIIQSSEKDGISIFSEDYKKEYYFSADEINPQNIYEQGRLSSTYFKEMLFVVLLCRHFGVTRKIHLKLSSGAPAGSGLGGSSAMGITLAQALLKYKNQTIETHNLISQVRKIEELILNRGVAGYQDFFPAAFGGILALRPEPSKIQVEQLYDSTLANFLQENLTLVYSGKSRLSGINNWEVYKAFFDEELPVIQGLTDIAQVSNLAYNAIKNKQWDELLTLIAKEGSIREKLFSNIVTPEMKALHLECQKSFKNYRGIKVCGAGGGGCFLLVGLNHSQAASLIEKHSMRLLNLEVAAPL